MVWVGYLACQLTIENGLCFVFLQITTFNISLVAHGTCAEVNELKNVSTSCSLSMHWSNLQKLVQFDYLILHPVLVEKPQYIMCAGLFHYGKLNVVVDIFSGRM
jgi:hypothetical protein